MKQSALAEIEKFNLGSFSEALIDLMVKSEFVKIDGNAEIVKDIKHNETQNIIILSLSDGTTFTLNIK